MKRQHGVILVLAVLVILGVWLGTSGGLRAKAKAQVDVATGAGDDGPVNISLGLPVNTGTIPGKYPVHIPAGAHMGRHRMYGHPAQCSPNMATLQMRSAWMFAPPSEGDL